MPAEPTDPRHRTATLPKGALGTLDWLRALSAIAVLAGHVRGLFFVDYAEVPHPGSIARVLYLLTGLGHQAVIVFFVLSGFFIGYSVLEARLSQRFSAGAYALRRFARIYVVLVPALAVTAVLDHVGIAWFGTHDTAYGGQVHARLLEQAFIPDRLGFDDLLANLLQLQPITGADDFGSNGVLWSLPYEVWAYVIFPVIVTAWATRDARALVASVLLLCGVVWVGSKAVLYLSIWSLGVATAWWWLRIPRRPSTAAASWLPVAFTSVAFALCVVLGRIQLLRLRALEDLLVAIATAVFICALLSRPRAWEPGPTTRWGAWLAGFSYSVYLFHQPMVTFLHAAMMGPERWVPTVTTTAAGLAMTAAVLFLWCYPMSLLSERHTDRVRRWGHSVLARSRATTQA